MADLSGSGSGKSSTGGAGRQSILKPGGFKSAHLRGSPSCHEILPRLYLGDYHTAVNKDEMIRLGITDMVTAEIKPIPPMEMADCIKRYLYINVMDHPKQDILSHFEVSNEFINNALRDPANKVYVHCVAGISRSASLVIAYIMQSRRMNYAEAHGLVSKKRSFIDPNEGFTRQLKLWHKMHYSIDLTNIEYRRVVLDALVFEFRLIALSYYQVEGSKSTLGFVGTSASTTRANIIQIPVHSNRLIGNRDSIGLLFDQYYSKLHLQQVAAYAKAYDPKAAHRCKKCRAIVFYAISIIENAAENNANQQSSTPTTSSRTMTTGQQGKALANTCPFVFIEPQPWMSKNILERDGDLECYKCKVRLGKFDWTGGESCSCELHSPHINHNLFKIIKKKIDLS